MKKYTLLAASIIIVTNFLAAQTVEKDLPASTLIPHYRLQVSYRSTTILIFPAAVKPPDRGARDILAIKQPGVENVLKVKAAKKDFEPTNLHVFTSDGNVYAFDVYFTDSLAPSHDLSGAQIIDVPKLSTPPVLYSGQLLGESALHLYVTTLAELPAGKSFRRIRHERMSVKVDQICQTGPLMLFRMQVSNRSNIPYIVDYFRCYIRDRQKTRRTSVQEIDQQPIYQDTTQRIDGHSSSSFIFAFPLFTLANHKEFVIDMHERNGGRSINLTLSSAILLRATSLKPSDHGTQQ